MRLQEVKPWGQLGQGITQDEAPVLTFAFAALEHRAVHIPQESIKKCEHMPVGRERSLRKQQIWRFLLLRNEDFPCDTVQAQATLMAEPGLVETAQAEPK